MKEDECHADAGPRGEGIENMLDQEKQTASESYEAFTLERLAEVTCRYSRERCDEWLRRPSQGIQRTG